MEKKYVAFYRVSTQRQGIDGLGMQAQQDIIKNFVSDGKIIAEFSEVASGKRKKKQRWGQESSERQTLREALEVCKKENAILIIAKIDRLTRELELLVDIEKSGVQFIFCNHPDANIFTIRLYVIIAEKELADISQRTKAALGVLKRNGKKLGTPSNLTKEAQKKSVESIKANARKGSACIAKQIDDLLKQGLSLRKIAEKLNEYGRKTSTGKKFAVSTVQYLIRLHELKKGV